VRGLDYMSNHILHGINTFDQEAHHIHILEGLSEIFNSIIIKTSLDGTIHYITPNTEELLGFEVGELKGSKITDFLHEKDIYDTPIIIKIFPLSMGMRKNFPSA
ncbi:MAG TPA: PAS domain-containing protein, partial [Bacillota bacterium]|nr:PAS domain-containing protein [Bacillota bacterium]